jgi:choline kinase
MMAGAGLGTYDPDRAYEGYTLLCESYDDLAFEFIHSEDFRKTNNSYSLWLARECLREGFTLVNSDTLFPIDCLDRLREHDGSALVVDADKELDEEEMMVRVEDGRVVAIGKDLERGDGEYIGLCKFESEDAPALVRHLDELVEQGRTDEWYEAAFDRLVPDQRVGIVEVRNDWIEIDDREDPRASKRLWGEA